MSRDFEDIFVLEPENFDEWHDDAQEDCRRTIYKSFANSLKNGCNFIHAINPLAKEESDSNLIDLDEYEEEISITSSKKNYIQELPKGFQNPMISPLKNDSVENKVSARINFQYQERSILNSLKTVISFDVSSSYQSSENYHEYRERNFEKSVASSNGEGSHNTSSDYFERSSSSKFENRFYAGLNESSYIQHKIEKQITKLYTI